MPDARGGPERYLTTVLMTDIVGSTEHAAELGDSDWRDIVGQHHRIVRAALQRHRGREIDTAGDGFFAIFDAPAAAVASALEIADGVAALGIEIRAGIHTGEVEQSGKKVAGITVPIAARIMSLAQPSQVLVSATVRDLAAGASLSFADAGRHQLKGVPGEWQVYAVEPTSPIPLEAGLPEDPGVRRAAAVRRARSRPIWQRRSRLIALVAVALVAVIVVGALLVWQPWLPPALAEVGSDSVGVIDSGRSVIVESIKVDSRPSGIAIDGTSSWVANTGSDTVSQIDLASHIQTRVIDVGRSPVGIAAAGGSIWVGNSGDRTVSRINGASGRVVDTIQVGNGPLALAAAGGSVWVANATDSTLSRIDATSGAVTPAIAVAAGPIGLAADGTGLWVVSADAASVTHLDAATGVTLASPIALSSRPTSIAAGAGSVWVANADGTVTRIDPRANRVVATVDVGGALSAIAASASGVWVADRDGRVLRLDSTDPAAPAESVATANAPAALAVQAGNVWVAAGSAPTAHRGGTLRIVDIGPPGMDIDNTVGPVQLEADGLVAYRRVGGSAGGTLVADLATSLPRPTDGGLKYTFQLRQGLRYSTGEPVLASDFRRALERSFLIADAVGNVFFMAVTGADACVTDDGTLVTQCDLSAGVLADDAAGVVTFVLTRADPDFLYALATAPAYPVPPSVPKDATVQGAFPGTGPYTVTGPADGPVTLTRNPGFTPWDTDARPDGFPDEIQWLVAASADEAAAMVQRGEADYMRLSLDNRPSPDVLATIRSQFTGQLHYASNSVTSVNMNTSVAPFDSLEARRAVNFALDRAHLVELRGGPSAAAITCQTLPPGWPAYQPYCPYTTHPDPGGRWQAPDLDAARQLVAQSGTTGAKVVVGPALPIFNDIRDYLVDVLDELGYDASADTNTDGDYVFSQADAGSFQISVWEWFQAKLTPGDPLVGFECDVNGTFTNYCDPEFDALAAEAKSLQTTDPAAANEKWAQADRMIVDAAPWAPLFNEGSDFVSERLGNYQFHLYYGALLDQMWVQ